MTYVSSNPNGEITVNLEEQTISVPSIGISEQFEINTYKKTCLMNGYDDIDYLLSKTNDIEVYEASKILTMKLDIALLSGDGIGPEVTEQAVKALKAIAVEFDHTFLFHPAPVGAVAIDETGNPLPDHTLEICKTTDAILFGAIGSPKYDNDPTAKVRPEQGPAY